MSAAHRSVTRVSAAAIAAAAIAAATVSAAAVSAAAMAATTVAATIVSTATVSTSTVAAATMSAAHWSITRVSVATVSAPTVAAVASYGRSASAGQPVISVSADCWRSRNSTCSSGCYKGFNRTWNWCIRFWTGNFNCNGIGCPDGLLCNRD